MIRVRNNPKLRSSLTNGDALPTTLTCIVATFLLSFATIPPQEFSWRDALCCFALAVSAIWIWSLARWMRQLAHTEEQVLHLPFGLAKDEQLFGFFVKYSEALGEIRQIPDPVFRQSALSRLDSVHKLLVALGQGTVVFDNTESWRLAYEQLLRSKHVFYYRSVAWIKDADYWQDEPGKQSLQLNLDLIEAGQLRMERICIIRDDLWNQSNNDLDPTVLKWIGKQSQAGIIMRTIRESTLVNDADLICDLGIYGSHAIGQQLTSEPNHNSRFILQFDLEAVEVAESKWNRLLAYAPAFIPIFEQPP